MGLQPNIGRQHAHLTHWWDSMARKTAYKHSFTLMWLKLLQNTTNETSEDNSSIWLDRFKRDCTLAVCYKASSGNACLISAPPPHLHRPMSILTSLLMRLFFVGSCWIPHPFPNAAIQNPFQGTGDSVETPYTIECFVLSNYSLKHCFNTRIFQIAQGKDHL